MRDEMREWTATFSFCHEPRTCSVGSVIWWLRWIEGSGWRHCMAALHVDNGRTS